MWKGYPLSSYLCVHQQQDRGVFGSFICMTSWAGVGFMEGALHSNGKVVLLRAWRKQALGERCEGGLAIAALHGTCIGFDWQLFYNPTGDSSDIGGCSVELLSASSPTSHLLLPLLSLIRQRGNGRRWDRKSKGMCGRSAAHLSVLM